MTQAKETMQAIQHAMEMTDLHESAQKEGGPLPKEPLPDPNLLAAKFKDLQQFIDRKIENRNWTSCFDISMLVLRDPKP